MAITTLADETQFRPDAGDIPCPQPRTSRSRRRSVLRRCFLCLAAQKSSPCTGHHSLATASRAATAHTSAQAKTPTALRRKSNIRAQSAALIAAN